MTSASDIMRFLRLFGASAEPGKCVFAISASNSLQKSSGNTKNFSNFTLGNHDIVFIVWYL